MSQHGQQGRRQGGSQQEHFSSQNRNRSDDDWHRHQLGDRNEHTEPWHAGGNQGNAYQINDPAGLGRNEGFGQESRGGDRDAQTQFDPDYNQWRRDQMKALDDDYRQWREDRYKKFSDEFSTWRTSRSQSGQAQAGDADAPSGKQQGKDNKPS